MVETYPSQDSTVQKILQELSAEGFVAWEVEQGIIQVGKDDPVSYIVVPGSLNIQGLLISLREGVLHTRIAQIKNQYKDAQRLLFLKEKDCPEICVRWLKEN